VVVGVATSVRYFEAALGGGLLLALLWFRRPREAGLLAVSAAVTYGLLAAVPVALGVHLFGGGYQVGLLRWSPESPFNMLFTLKRGLLVWTPVTALAAVGYALLARRRPDLRPYLGTLGVCALALLLAQALVPFWDAGWSFSQRYLTPLFPLFAIGIAGLLEWRPRLVAVLSAAAIAWTLFLAMTMQTLSYDETKGGVDELIQLAGGQSPGSYAFGVYHISHLRVLVPYDPFGRG
jgi:hypothetical protein